MLFIFFLCDNGFLYLFFLQKAVFVFVCHVKSNLWKSTFNKNTPPPHFWSIFFCHKVKAEDSMAQVWIFGNFRPILADLWAKHFQSPWFLRSRMNDFYYILYFFMFFGLSQLTKYWPSWLKCKKISNNAIFFKFVTLFEKKNTLVLHTCQL